MDRSTALNKLRERYDEDKERNEQSFHQYITEHYDELIEKLYEGIRHLDTDYPIHIVQFQLMRSDIYHGNSRIRICGYDENWYMDEKRTEYDIDAEGLFQAFQDTIDRLNQEISVYMGSVTIYDIRNLVCEHFIDCFCKEAMLIRQGFLAFDEWADRNHVTLQAPYRIVWGVYRKTAETLFNMDRPGKGTTQLEQECKKNNLFLSFAESRLENLDISKENFAYFNVKNSYMSHMGFEECVFGEAMFKKTQIEWSSFVKSTFYGCNFNEAYGYQLDFSGASITNSCFDMGKIRKGRFDGAVLTDVTFTESILEECSFKNCRLCRVDLRAESLSGIDFEGAILEEVYIHMKDVDELELTKEQREHVYVLKEETDALLHAETGQDAEKSDRD